MVVDLDTLPIVEPAADQRAEAVRADHQMRVHRHAQPAERAADVRGHTPDDRVDPAVDERFLRAADRERADGDRDLEVRQTPGADHRVRHPHTLEQAALVRQPGCRRRSSPGVTMPSRRS